TVTLRPMIMLPRAAHGNGNGAAHEEELLPVKSIPGHFSTVMEATEEDVNRIFGAEGNGQPYFHIGSPLDMEAPVCLNLDRFVERSNGIFGKSGTGKTFLTRMVLCGLVRSSRAVNLIFDMHSEYGWKGTYEGAGRAEVRGLRQYFPTTVEVFPLDADSARRRGERPDYEIKIPYRQVTVEDVILLQEELNLTPTAAETAYALVNQFKDDWLDELLKLDPKEFCKEHEVHEGALAALKRKLSVLARECEGFLRPTVTDDAVERI